MKGLKTISSIILVILGSVHAHAQIDPIFIADIPNEVDESSGLQKTGNNSYWTHNDTGNEPRIYNINENGDFLTEIELLNSTSIDWEDVAYDGELFLYIGDFGNNLNNRTDLKIYRIPNPDILITSIIPEVINFTLSDQTAFPPNEDNLNFDIEAMFYFDDHLHLFSKNRTDPYNGIIKHYRLDPTLTTPVAQLVNTHFGNLSPDHSSITAADINALGTRIVLLSNSSVFVFSNFTDDDFFSGDLNYNFFNSTERREGITFKDNCSVLISQEQDDFGNLGKLEELNTCDIISSIGENPVSELNILNFAEHIEIQSSNPIVQFSILDISGKSIFSKNAFYSNTFAWNTQDISKGIYIVQGTLSDGSQFRQKLLVE